MTGRARHADPELRAAPSAARRRDAEANAAACEPAPALHHSASQGLPTAILAILESEPADPGRARVRSRRHTRAAGNELSCWSAAQRLRPGPARLAALSRARGGSGSRWEPLPPRRWAWLVRRLRGASSRLLAPQRVLADWAATSKKGPERPGRGPFRTLSGGDYPTLTSMARGLTFSPLGRRTFSIPSLKSACTLVSSTLSGSVKVRRNEP
jgi:hypothetical protein